MAVFGLQALLTSYGAVLPNSLMQRTLLTLATVGIVGGIASFRIRRLPG
jgi:hypothetical protein